MTTRPGRVRWWTEGIDPDYRYSLANERTFLAWIRTALAFVAGAVAVVQLVPSFSVVWARSVLGLLLAVAGVLIAALAYLRWRATERAMRLQQRLPRTRVTAVISGVTVTVGAVVLLLVLTDVMTRVP